MKAPTLVGPRLSTDCCSLSSTCKGASQCDVPCSIGLRQRFALLIVKKCHHVLVLMQLLFTPWYTSYQFKARTLQSRGCRKIFNDAARAVRVRSNAERPGLLGNACCTLPDERETQLRNRCLRNITIHHIFLTPLERSRSCICLRPCRSARSSTVLPLQVI